MSTPESTVPLRRTTPQTLSARLGQFAGLARRALHAVQFVAFWLAALLPLAYLPLFATKAVTDPHAFVGVLALNAVALVCGHSYDEP